MKKKTPAFYLSLTQANIDTSLLELPDDHNPMYICLYALFYRATTVVCHIPHTYLNLSSVKLVFMVQ